MTEANYWIIIFIFWMIKESSLVSPLGMETSIWWRFFLAIFPVNMKSSQWIFVIVLRILWQIDAIFCSCCYIVHWYQSHAHWSMSNSCCSVKQSVKFLFLEFLSCIKEQTSAIFMDEYLSINLLFHWFFTAAKYEDEVASNVMSSSLWLLIVR